jgi:hypothetical protein
MRRKDKQRDRQCNGKVKYASRAHALRFLNSRKLKHYPYKCQSCKAWHTGHHQSDKIQDLIDEVTGEKL